MVERKLPKRSIRFLLQFLFCSFSLLISMQFFYCSFYSSFSYSCSYSFSYSFSCHFSAGDFSLLISLVISLQNRQEPAAAWFSNFLKPSTPKCAKRHCLPPDLSEWIWWSTRFCEKNCATYRKFRLWIDRELSGINDEASCGFRNAEQSSSFDKLKLKTVFKQAKICAQTASSDGRT